MRLHIRNLVWLVATSVAVLSLAAGALLAHEGRPVGDYRFTVGWLEEPAYEGSRNAVSVRVNKIVASEVTGANGVQEEGHDEPGNNAGDPGSTSAMSHEKEESGPSEEHHGGEDKGDQDTGSSHGTEDQHSEEGEDHKAPTATPAASHDDSDGHHDPAPGPSKTGDPQPSGAGQDERHDSGGTNGGEGYGGGQTSRLILPQGAAKPLASVAGQDESVAVPLENLEGSLQVEVSHVATGASRILDLEAAWGDPGHYVARLIPTAAGVYEFRVFGTIEGTAVDETFVSAGAGGDFDDVQTSADLQFPEQLPGMREVVAAAQGARDIAQQAQDTALAAQSGSASDGGGGGNALAVVALIIGIVGAALGAGGVFMAVRARQPH